MHGAITTIICLVAIFSLSSCATIMHGTRQTVGITSNPTNASVWVDRMYVGNTPILVDMTRKDNHIVTIALEGYQTYEATFSRKLSGWVLGNIVFGGVIGLAFDAISGGIYMLTPDQVHAEMRTSHAVHSKHTPDSYVAIVLKPDPNWKKIGNLTPVQ